MNTSFSESAKLTLEKSLNIARELGHSYVGTEHLLLAISGQTADPCARKLAMYNITYPRIEEVVCEIGGRGTTVSDLNANSISPALKSTIALSSSEAQSSSCTSIGNEHLLRAMLVQRENVGCRILSLLGTDAGILYSSLSPKPAGRTTPKNSSTPTLSKYTTDLTQLAATGNIDPVCGREREIARVIQILSRRTKNNPCLIGEAGVGKTAIAEGLALLICRGEVPEHLTEKRILSLDIAGLVAGAKYRGEFEERFKSLLTEVKSATDIILFADEVHLISGAGAAEGCIDAAGILKPMLARGEVSLMGATTLAEYRRCIESDSALERRFSPVLVEEPDEEQCRNILLSVRPGLERHHGVPISDSALTSAVTLSGRYVPDRHFPDKAIDLLDEAAAAKRISHGGAVGPADIAEVIRLRTGIPAGRLEGVEGLAEALKAKVFGQNEAIDAVVRAVQRGRLRLSNPVRPIGSFLFCGPSGVGKTELASVLARELYGEKNSFIRLDMAEFSEGHSVAKLIGSPPGYIGYGNGGQLVNRVRNAPCCVVLFDELEKAHPEVINTLLAILENGVLTDTDGKTASFKEAVIIMTTNAGADAALGKKKVGFNEVAPGTAGLRSELSKFFRPEFVNRIDEVVAFSRLSEESLLSVARLCVENIQKRLIHLGITLEVDESVFRLLLPENLSAGARDIRRRAEELVTTYLCEQMSDGKLSGARLTAVDGMLTLLQPTRLHA